ncbi:MAG: efflux RND transporter periplasmic adaptor subunit [Bacteroidota bacterium]
MPASHNLSSTSAMSMDRKINRPKWPPTKIALYTGVPLLIIALGAFMIKGAGVSRLRASKDRLTISAVQQGPFQEFVPINGTVQPIKSVLVTAIEGGQVKEVFMEGGELVKKGDVIMKLTNPGLELNYMNLQTQLLEQADQLRNTKITLETSGLVLKDQLAQIDFQVSDLGQQYQRSAELFKDSVIAEQEFISLENNLRQFKRRQGLMNERIEKDSVLRGQQLVQVDKSLALVARNLDAIQSSLANLTVTAPISGQLSSVRVEIGETVNQGQSIGQVDVLNGYKVRANIDEHYISRIRTGLKGTFSFSGGTYALEVAKVYPEVTNGTFEVDMILLGKEPAGIKRGQTLQIRLALSEEKQATTISRGGFYSSTGGNWVYVLSEDGKTARKRTIRIGQQSDRSYEILEGLSPGEQVITSNYELFNDVDELVLE